MKSRIRNGLVKLLALTLAIIVGFPVQIFAQALTETRSTTYDGTGSVMGIQSGDGSATAGSKTDSKVLSTLTKTDNDHYIVEESAELSKVTGELTYKITLKPKTPAAENDRSMLKAVFGVNKNTDNKDLAVNKVATLDASGKETEAKFTQATTNFLNTNPNISTLSVKTERPQFGVVYYLSSKVTDKSLAYLSDSKRTAPVFALDMAFAHDDTPLFNKRYALSAKTTDNTTELVDLGNQADSLIKGSYTKETKNIFGQTTPATITWTDFIYPESDKPFQYDLSFDRAQDLTDSEIKIEFFEPKENGFILNNSYTQKMPYVPFLDLELHDGQLARVEVTTKVNLDPKVKYYTFNKRKVSNPDYQGETSNTTEEDSADDADPLPVEETPEAQTTKKAAESNSSSGIELNKAALLAKLKDEERLDNNTENFINRAVETLEDYNRELVTWEQFLNQLATAAGEYKLDEASIEEVVAALIADLSEDKYKVATIDPAEVAGLSYSLGQNYNNQSRVEVEVEAGENLPETAIIDPQILKEAFSAQSGIALNKAALVDKLKDEDRLDSNTKYFIKSAVEALENYNIDVITEDQFISTLSTSAGIYKVEEPTIAEVVDDLTTDLSEDKYKVANIDAADIAARVYQSATTPTQAFVADEVEVDSGAPLWDDVEVEEGAPIWDDIEVEYGASTAFAGKKFPIYTEVTLSPVAGPVQQYQQFQIKLSEFLTVNNPATLQTLYSGGYQATPVYDARTNTITYTLNKNVPQRITFTINQQVDFNTAKIPSNAEYIHVRNSVRGLGMLNSGALPSITYDKNGTVVGGSHATSGPDRTRSYPYDITYYSHQYYDPKTNRVNWDIRIHTEELLDANVDFGSLGLALYAPETQSLEDYKVQISDYPTDEMTTGTFANRKIELGFLSGNEPKIGNVLVDQNMTGKTGALHTYNRRLESYEVPDVLYIHVDAKPGDLAPKLDNYDLGIRLTPSNNYIQKMMNDFQKEADRLSVAPFTYAYIKEKGLVDKFSNGFNVVDTRLPAIVNIPDNEFLATSYADKSRSITGRYNSSNMDFLFSDTIRIQDDTSQLGEDALYRRSAKLEKLVDADPTVEILVPNADGSYTINTYKPGDTNTGIKLRRTLGNEKGPALKPGTIINYRYYNLRPQNSDTTPAELRSEPISQRFDDGVGYYGGSNVAATLRRLTDEEKVFGERFKVIYLDRITGKPAGDYDRIGGMVIAETGDLVYCINAEYISPAGITAARDVNFNEKYADISGAQLNALISRPTDDTAALIRRLKAIFYTAEYSYTFPKLYPEGYTWSPERAKFEIVQAALYKAVDEMNNGKGANTSELQHYYAGFSSTGPENAYKRAIDPELQKFYAKVLQEEKRLGNQLDYSVQIDGYKTHIKPGKSRQVQNVLGPVFKEPVKFEKLDHDNNPIKGITFEILDEYGIPVHEWTTNGEPHQVMLLPGRYTLRETNSGNYKALKDTEFEIAEMQKAVQRYDTLDYSSGSEVKGKITNNKYQQYFVNYSSSNIDSKYGQLINYGSNNDSATLIAKNVPKEEVKPVYGSFSLKKTDEKTGNTLSNATFQLYDSSGKAYGRAQTTGSNGILSFSNLPVDTYTLREIGLPSSEYIDEGNTWTIEVYNDRGVAKTRYKLNDSSFNSYSTNHTISITNRKKEAKTGRFDLQKYEKGTTIPVGSVKFVLSDNNSSWSQPRTTDTSGKLSFDNIPAGRTYTLRETSSPAKYETNTKTWKVIVDANGNTTIDGQSTNTISSTSVIRNNQSFSIGNNGSGVTSITDLGSNRFRIDTTLTGKSTGGSQSINNNVLTNGPSHISSYYPEWHFLHMDNYGKTFYDGNQAKSDYYIILNSEKDLGRIRDKTTLDLQATNLNIKEMRMVNVGHNNANQTKTDIDTFKRSPEALWQDIGGWTQQLDTGGMSVSNKNTTNRRTIVIDPFRFGPNGDFVFLLKVSADVIDVNRPTGLNVNWYYQDAPQQDMWKNEAKNNIALDAIGPRYISNAGSNSLQGYLYHNIGNGFSAENSNSTYINQGNGSSTFSTTVRYNGSSTGNLYPLSSVQFSPNSGYPTTINQNSLPYISISNTTSGNGELIVYNELKKVEGQFKIYKTGSDTKKALSGATFQLYKSDSDGVTPYGQPQTTGSSGILTWANLPVDTYILKETSVNGNYKISDDVWTIEIINNNNGTASARYKKNNGYWSYGSNNLQIPIVNEKIDIPSDFSLTKVSSTDYDFTLAGAKFRLVDYYNNSKYYDSNESTSNGVINFTNIRNGTYYLREIQKPRRQAGKSFDNVRLNENIAMITFKDGNYTINNQGSLIIGNNVIKVSNPPDETPKDDTYNFELTKRDENDLPLPGADFELINQATGQKITPTKKENGTVFRFENLKYNVIYQLVETKVPAGYKKAEPQIIYRTKATANSNVDSLDLGREIKAGNGADNISISDAEIFASQLQTRVVNKDGIDVTVPVVQNGEAVFDRKGANEPFYAIANHDVKQQQDRLTLSFKFKVGENVKPGDYFILKDSEITSRGLNLEGIRPLPIYDASGKRIAVAFYDNDAKQTYYIFTEYVDLFDNVTGQLILNDYIIDSNKVLDNQRVNVVHNIAGTDVSQSLNVVYPSFRTRGTDYMNSQAQVYGTNYFDSTMSSVIYLNPMVDRRGPNRDTALALRLLNDAGQIQEITAINDEDIVVYEIPAGMKSKYMTKSVATILKDSKDSIELTAEAKRDGVKVVNLPIYTNYEENTKFVMLPKADEASRWGGKGYIVDILSSYEGKNSGHNLHYNWITLKLDHQDGDIPVNTVNLEGHYSLSGTIGIATTDTKTEGSGRTNVPDPIKMDLKNYPEEKFGKIKITKTDTENKALKGAVFNLYNENEEVIRSGLATSDTGELYIWNLPLGTYYLEETKTPAGHTFEGDNNWTTIVVTENGSYYYKGKLDARGDLPTTDANGNKLKLTVTDGVIRPDEDKEVEKEIPLSSTQVSVSPNLVNVKVIKKGTGFFGRDTTVYLPVKNGVIDFANQSNGTYIYEDGQGYRITLVKNGSILNVEDKQSLAPVQPSYQTRDSWSSATNYQQHNGGYNPSYPSFVNSKDYSTLSNPATGEITTYIMLKPRRNSDLGGNGTDKNTILDLNTTNMTIKSIDIYRGGNGDRKDRISKAMDDQDVQTLIGTTSGADLLQTNEPGQNAGNSIEIDGIARDGTYKPNSRNVRLTLPKGRFTNDWSFVIKVTSTLDNKRSDANMAYTWKVDSTSETTGIQSLTRIPAIETRTGSRGFKLNSLLMPTAYAAAAANQSYADIKVDTIKPADIDFSDSVSYNLVNIPNEITFTKTFVDADGNVITDENYSLDFGSGASANTANFELAFVSNPTGATLPKGTIADNVIAFKNLPQGRYQLKETVPTGFVETQPITFEVNEAGKIIYDNGTPDNGTPVEKINVPIVNKKAPKFGITIKKVDSKGNKLTGAEFSLSADNNFPEANTETKPVDESGIVVFDKLDPNKTYYLKESKMPTGYLDNNEVYIFSLDNDGNIVSTKNSINYKIIDNRLSIEVKNTHKPPRLVITKIGPKEENVDGVEFTLVGGGETKTATTDGDGLANFGELKLNTSYTLSETKAKEDYIKTDKTWTVSVDQHGDITVTDNKKTIRTEYKVATIEDEVTKIFTTDITITNDKYGEFKLIKNGENGRIANAEFKLEKYNTTQGWTVVSDYSSVTTTADADLEFKNLTEGTYRLTETRAPDGHIRAGGFWEIVVAKNGNTTIKANTAYDADIVNEPFEGSMPELTVTNKPNEIKFVKTFTGTGVDESEYEVKFALNPHKKGKGNEDYNPKAAYFILKKDDVTNPEDTYKYNEAPYLELDSENRSFTFRNLPTGSYTLIETGVPEGFNSQGEYKFTVEADGTIKIGTNPYDGNEVTIENSLRPKGRFEIDKVSTNGTSLEGAKFVLAKVDESTREILFFTKDKTFTTDESQEKNIVRITNDEGKVEFTDIPIDDYLLVEVEAHKGYILPDGIDAVYEVNVNEEGKVTISKDGSNITTEPTDNPTVTIENKSNFRLKKVDFTTKNGLRGANFIISTDINEVIRLNEEKVKYEFVENEDALNPPKPKYHFIPADGEEPLNPEKPKYHFELVDDLRNQSLTFASGSTDEEGYVSFEGLDVGRTYYISEAIAPAGYILTEQIFKLTINRDGSINTEQSYIVDKDGNKVKDIESLYSVTNDKVGDVIEVSNKVPGEFILRKTNSADKELDGAKFEFKPEDAPGAKTREIDVKNGVIKVTDIIPGTYILKETEAPLGYYFPRDLSWKVEVKADGTIDIKANTNKYDDQGLSKLDEDDAGTTRLNVVNSQTSFPLTGGPGTTIAFALVGTAVMVIGIAYYGMYMNNKNRRRSR